VEGKGFYIESVCELEGLKEQAEVGRRDNHLLL